MRLLNEQLRAIWLRLNGGIGERELSPALRRKLNARADGGEAAQGEQGGNEHGV